MEKLPPGGVRVIDLAAVVQEHELPLVSAAGYHDCDDEELAYVAPWAQAVIVPSTEIKAPPQKLTETS